MPIDWQNMFDAIPFPRSGSAPQTSNAVVNTVLSFVLPMLFGQMRDARWTSSFGGPGSFRPSDNYMRAMDTAERSRAMGVVAEPDIAAEVRRLTAEYATRVEQAGGVLGEGDLTRYANSSAVQDRARQAARGRLMAKEETSLRNLTQLFYTTSLMSHDPATLTDEKRQELMDAAQQRAVKIRETLAGSPLMASAVTWLARKAEEMGATGISNIDPKFFLGGSVYDTLRTASPFNQLPTGMAGDIAEGIASRMFKDGVTDYGFTRGRSAIQIGDTLGSAQRLGLLDMSAVATGRAGTIDSARYKAETSKIYSDVQELNEVYESMEDLFGPGGSFEELFERVSKMTAGAIRTMTKQQINRVIQEVSYLSRATGRPVEQVEAMLAAGTEYAARSGLDKTLGLTLTAESIEHADAAVRARGGAQILGGRSAEELASDLMLDKVSAMGSADIRSMASLTETARVRARGLGIEGADSLDLPDLLDEISNHWRFRDYRTGRANAKRLRRAATAIRSLREGTATAEDAWIGSAAGARDIVAAMQDVNKGSTEGFDYLAYYEMSREMQGKVVEAELPGLTDHAEQLQRFRKQEHIVQSAASHIMGLQPDLKPGWGEDEQSYRRRVRGKTVRDLTMIHEILRSSDTPITGPADAVELLTSKAARRAGLRLTDTQAALYVNMMDQVMTDIMPGESGGFYNYINRHGVRQQQMREEMRRTHEVWTAKDERMRAQGIGSGSVFQKLVDSLLTDPTQSDKGALAPLIIGEVQEKEFAAVSRIARDYVAAQRDITDRLEAGKGASWLQRLYRGAITPEQAQQQRDAVTEKMLENVESSEATRKELSELQLRRIPDEKTADEVLGVMGTDVSGIAKDVKTIAERGRATAESTQRTEVRDDLKGLALAADGEAAAQAQASVMSARTPGGSPEDMAANMYRVGRQSSGTVDTKTHVSTYAVAPMTGAVIGASDGPATGGWHHGGELFTG